MRRTSGLSASEFTGAAFSEVVARVKAKNMFALPAVPLGQQAHFQESWEMRKDRMRILLKPTKDAQGVLRLPTRAQIEEYRAELQAGGNVEQAAAGTSTAAASARPGARHLTAAGPSRFDARSVSAQRMTDTLARMHQVTHSGESALELDMDAHVANLSEHHKHRGHAVHGASHQGGRSPHHHHHHEGTRTHAHHLNPHMQHSATGLPVVSVTATGPGGNMRHGATALPMPAPGPVLQRGLSATARNAGDAGAAGTLGGTPRQPLTRLDTRRRSGTLRLVARRGSTEGAPHE